MPEAPAAQLLLWAVLPLWLAAGLADWACHRATAIERTSGTRESLIHLLMFAEVGLPLLAALLLEVNALVLAAGLLAFLAHEATAWWDLRVAVGARAVHPREQMVHSFLELLPLTGLALLATLHWTQARALVPGSAAPGAFELVWKTPPLPAAYVLAVLAAAGLVSALYLEELWRCLRASRLDPSR